ncbi:MAG TPA: hypothetical protein VE282_03140 [Gemmatimonadales bacterium]|nr:hypothetical protein [Gemmatimonadales bacterium]
MTAQKDFKRLVRGRMQKTGEAYTTARRHLLKQTPVHRHSAQPASSDYAKLAGKSDAILKEKTGCTWERWVGALDGVKAYTWPHTEIARYVQEKYKTPGWWAQTVTVGYERIKGLRAVGQRRDGWFEANKSKTLKVPVGRVYEAFHNPALRARWLSGIDLTVRTATRNKSMRITWPDGTLVIAGFTSMGRGKSQVALTHAKLPDQATVTRVKQYWAERLAELEKLLAAL